MKAETFDDTKQFLIEQVLMDPDRESNIQIKKRLQYISRERIDKPVIYVGMATCGRIAGAGKTHAAIHDYLTENNINAELIEGGCMGLCQAEPVVDIQLPGKARISFAHITSDRVQHLLDDVLNNHIPDITCLGQYNSKIHQPWDKIPPIDQHPFFVRQKRLITTLCGFIDPNSIEAYISKGGYWAFADTISNLTPQQVCRLLDDSMLLGRGGGGFPVGKKWDITLNTVSDQKYFVCNAVESDPGSYMNRAIIESDPHRLIEALLIACYAIGASKAFLFIRKEFTLAINRLRMALLDAQKYGLTGHHIFNSGVNIDIVIKEGARAFVCGEETALNNSIEGKRAMPASKPPYPAEKGLWNKPTIVNNVETLYNIPSILRHGPDWYTQTGTEASKGTKLFTLSGKTKYYGTIEVPMGISFREIVAEIAGGMSTDKPFKAIVLGINSGSFILNKTLDTLIDFQALRQIGSSLGSGAFVVLDESSCMVDMAKFFTAFFQKESCGKCIPCREGTARMLEIMEQAKQRPSSASVSFKPLERFKGVMQLKGLAAVIKDTSLCQLGKSSPNAILNTLTHFKDEFDMHIFERKCNANVCRELRIYAIDVDQCTGCTACYKKCPVDAIIGAARIPHFIVQDKCIGCGNCYEVCKFNAVTIT